MIRIITLGPEGSYSGMAVKRWNAIMGNKNGDIQYLEDTSDVIARIKSRAEKIGLIPIQNLLEGAVTSTLDLLAEYQVQICGEVYIKISHCLMVKESELPFTAILSHPQALAQCRPYLRKHYPDVPLIPTTSTSAAAARALRTAGVAAIASHGAAEKFGLQVLAENIQEKENYTRFVVISNLEISPSGNDKTSIIVYPCQNRSGVLHEILGEFADRGIDLTMVESRPTKEIFGEYIFHIDFKGHKKEQIVKETLRAILEKGHLLTVLGSYPIAKLNGA